MDKYTVVCTLYRLPKHQRRKLLGKPVTRNILGHNIIRERSFAISSDELALEWDNLKELYRRGELEVRNPDGTLLRFEKPKTADPPPEKVQKLPPATSAAFSSDFGDEPEMVAPMAPREKAKVEEIKEELPKPKKKRKRRKKKKEDSE